MMYNLIALNTPFLKHIGGATINALDPDRMAHTQLHRQKYIAKWYERLLDISEKVGHKDARHE